MAGDRDAEYDEASRHGRASGGGVGASDDPGEQVNGGKEVRVNRVVQDRVGRRGAI